ncbi:hypothetical protein MCOR31_008816 [Pyricularia oryzae]|nr:hypothetical protein MCOR26_004872 [Pyricularia oryzae]KAI6361113.1 hypothetical protein MCOR31_008816 [Pyricularia oryzae]KAI6584821.1 hypothetical protein MCOR04_004833 [Pyricularia oryzae]
MQIKSTRTNHTDQQWQYGTMAVHAGLDKSRHGECTVPIYNSAPSSSRPLPRPRMHSRQFQMSSGGSTAGLVTCLRQTISSSQNITSFTTTQRMGIETRFCDTYELPKVRSLVDQRTNPRQAGNGDRFPQLRNLYKILENRAYMQMLKWDFMRDTGACLAPASVQQLCVGLETLARGLNTLLTFGLRGGEAEMEDMGVYAGFLWLSVGVKHIDDIKRDFERAFERTAPANGRGGWL